MKRMVGANLGLNSSFVTYWLQVFRQATVCEPRLPPV